MKLPAATFLLCVAAFAARAGVIRGVVLDNGTGKPMARARVKLDIVTFNGSAPLASALTDGSGHFAFPSLPPGSFLISATRTGYFGARHAQRRKNGPAGAVKVEAEAST